MTLRAVGVIDPGAVNDNDKGIGIFLQGDLRFVEGGGVSAAAQLVQPLFNGLPAVVPDLIAQQVIQRDVDKVRQIQQLVLMKTEYGKYLVEVAEGL